MRRFVLSTALLSAALAPALARADNAAVEKEILAIVQREWAAEAKGDVDAMIKSKSRDLTMFDLGNPYRTDYTVDNAFVRAETKPGQVVIEEMLNPKVQVYGDVAILTYNFAAVVRGDGGKLARSFDRATRVYHKENGASLLVHAHFSDATPHS